jgi:hypothetical protein
MSTSQQSCKIDVIVRRASQVPEELEPDMGVSLQRARVETAAVLTASSQIANTGDLQGVRKALEQQLEQVTSLVSTAQRKGDTVVASIAGVLVADLQQALCEACDIDVYHRHGSKSMRMKGACRSAQRCSFLTPADHACESPQVNQFNFGTPKQLSMKKSLPGPPSSSGAN